MDKYQNLNIKNNNGKIFEVIRGGDLRTGGNRKETK